jgi:hypothetical protein
VHLKAGEGVTIVILLGIAALWAGYLSYLWIQGRNGGRSTGLRGGSVNLRPGALTAPGRSLARPGAGIGGLGPAVPPTPVAARRRRRDVLLGLGAIAALTLVLALAVGGPFWLLHLLADVALVGFGWLVHEHETRARERADKVHDLRTRRPAPTVADPGEPYRRVAN